MLNVQSIVVYLPRLDNGSKCRKYTIRLVLVFGYVLMRQFHWLRTCRSLFSWAYSNLSKADAKILVRGSSELTNIIQHLWKHLRKNLGLLRLLLGNRYHLGLYGPSSTRGRIQRVARCPRGGLEIEMPLPSFEGVTGTAVALTPGHTRAKKQRYQTVPWKTCWFASMKCFFLLHLSMFMRFWTLHIRHDGKKGSPLKYEYSVILVQTFGYQVFLYTLKIQIHPWSRIDGLNSRPKMGF